MFYFNTVLSASIDASETAALGREHPLQMFASKASTTKTRIIRNKVATRLRLRVGLYQQLNLEDIEFLTCIYMVTKVNIYT